VTLDHPRIGILGTGDAAALHAEHFRAAGAHVEWVSGRTPERGAEFARRWDVGSVVDDVHAMLEQGPDAVVVATPSDLHAEQVRPCLQAGIAVLCEIPLATSLPDLEELAQLDHDTPAPLMVAHTLRFDPAHRRLAAELTDTAVRHLVARRMMLRQSDTGWLRPHRSWTDDVLWHHGAHEVDRARWLLGAEGDVPLRVAGVVGPVWLGSGRPMDVSATLATDDGQLASLVLSYHSRAKAVDLTVVAEDHTWRLVDGSLWCDDEQLIEADPQRWEMDTIGIQDASFVAALRSGAPVSSSSADDAPAGMGAPLTPGSSMTGTPSSGSARPLGSGDIARLPSGGSITAGYGDSTTPGSGRAVSPLGATMSPGSTEALAAGEVLDQLTRNSTWADPA